jgi:hypothetical protein
MSNAIKPIPISVLIISAAVFMTAAYSAYKGHADDSDINAVLAAYPQLKGTAADSCATCHAAGQVAGSTAAPRNENHCGYCHAVHVKNKVDVRKTLNRYGADYLAARRGIRAIKTIARKDSDGDGFLNEAELLKGTNPGDFRSNPSLLIAPSRIYSAMELRSLSPAISETVFLNTSHNKQGDSYNDYKGNRIYELLQAAGISDNAESVDFISLDGFENSFTLSELKKEWPQGAPVMGLDKKTIGQCGWVNYYAVGFDEKKPLPSAKIMLAFEENGKKIETGKIDPETGRIRGTGPLRLVVPQFQVSPPDLPKFDASCRDKIAKEYQFNEDYDHNGGRSSFSIIAIRVNPLPKQTRDFEWQKIRDELAKDEKIVFFGALKDKKPH